MVFSGVLVHYCTYAVVTSLDVVVIIVYPLVSTNKFILYPINGPVGVVAFDQGFPKV